MVKISNFINEHLAGFVMGITPFIVFIIPWIKLLLDAQRMKNTTSDLMGLVHSLQSDVRRSDSNNDLLKNAIQSLLEEIKREVQEEFESYKDSINAVIREILQESKSLAEETRNVIEELTDKINSIIEKDNYKNSVRRMVRERNKTGGDTDVDALPEETQDSVDTE